MCSSEKTLKEQQQDLLLTSPNMTVNEQLLQQPPNRCVESVLTLKEKIENLLRPKIGKTLNSEVGKLFRDPLFPFTKLGLDWNKNVGTKNTRMKNQNKIWLAVITEVKSKITKSFSVTPYSLVLITFSCCDRVYWTFFCKAWSINVFCRQN